MDSKFLPREVASISSSGEVKVYSSKLGERTLVEIVESYVEYYASGEGHTARAKRYDLKHFLGFLAAGSGANPRELPLSAWTMQSTQDFVDSRLALGESPATVSRRLATLKHMGRTLAERVPGYINPAREVKSPVLAASRPHGLKAAEIELLREAALECEKRAGASFGSFRNRFLLELLLATGLRADEVRLLVLGQVKEDLHWLRNVKTKGRKFRSVYLESQIRAIAKAYLEARESQLLAKVPAYRELPDPEKLRFPVLVSVRGASIDNPLSFGLSPKTIWRIIADFGKRAQALSTQPIGNLHPHRLRHTFAHGLLDSSKDVRLVAQALGHSDVRTTMRYTERTEEELAKAIEKKSSTS